MGNYDTHEGHDPAAEEKADAKADKADAKADAADDKPSTTSTSAPAGKVDS